MSNTVSIRVFIAVGFTLGVTALAALAVRLRSSDLPIDRVSGLVARERQQPERPWRLLEGRHWQIVGDEGEAPEATDAREGNRGSCSPGMVEVAGQMKADPPRRSMFDPRSIEELQKRTCTKWIQREYPERCAEFDRDKWLALSRDLPTKPMHYCMDRFEYPNRKGVHPVIFVNFGEAEELCTREGKRLCSEDEWTFACEGEEATPYPYGYARSADACPIDGRWRAFNERALQPRDGEAAMLELDRLWQGVPSGARPGCRSVFGVYDLTGNIDEWTRSVREGERPSILKGGYWGPVRTRCRPSTRSHDEQHVFYQQGFRCCSNAPSPSPAASGAPSPSAIPSSGVAEPESRPNDALAPSPAPSPAFHPDSL
jgi:sulfatase modifying factor 1